LDTEEARKNVLEHFSEIVFSLDGFEKCHDRIRQRKGAFAKTSRAISQLSAQKAITGKPLSVQVNTILLRENIDEFRQFCEYLVSLGVNSLTFNQLGGFDRPEFYGDNRLLPEQVEQFSQNLPQIKREYADRGLTIYGGALYLERLRSSSQNQKIPVAECWPGKWFWFINENGFISPCSYTTYEYRLPTKTIQTINDIDHAEHVFRDMRKNRCSHWCGDCHCTQNHDKFS
jgi:MoaA/NifB/PqqE/SkfB family radical SAM enzyme